MNTRNDAKQIAEAFDRIYQAALSINEALSRNDVLNDTVPPTWPLNMSADEFAAECAGMKYHYEAVAEASEDEDEAKSDLTFEQFQATRRWCDNLPEAVSSEDWGEQDLGTPRGWLYMGVLYIDQVEEWWPDDCRREGKWHLILDRDEYITDDLERLERALYTYAISAGYSMAEYRKLMEHADV
jgi:hypothetical protein